MSLASPKRTQNGIPRLAKEPKRFLMQIYRLHGNECVIREIEGEARRECVREAGRCEMKVVEVCASEQATPCRNGQSHIVNKYSTHTDGHARCEGGFMPVADWAFFFLFF